MKVLQVAPDYLFPPNSGGRVDAWNRALALSQIGCDLDIVMTGRGALDPADLFSIQSIARQVIVVDRRPNRTGLLSADPIQVATRRRLRSVPLRERYDLVILEGEGCGAILDNPGLKADRIAIRIHNNEARFFEEQASSAQSFFKRLYFRVEAERYRKYLPKIHARVDDLWFISHDEWQLWSAKADRPRKASYWLPPGVKLNEMRENSAANKRVVFLGTLALPMNSEAIEWFYRQVHPLLIEDRDYHLTIAGNSLGAKLPGVLDEIARDDRCTVLKDVEDIHSLLAGCTVFVNPIQHGAGVKMKVLTAMEAGLPVVSTTTGCEGTGFQNGQHLMIADTAAEFAGAVRLILEQPDVRKKLTRNSKAFLISEYDQAAALSRLLTVRPSMSLHLLGQVQETFETSPDR